MSTVTAVITPWLMGYVVDVVLLPKKLELLVPAALLILGVSLARMLSTFVQLNILTKLGQNVLHDLRQDLLKQYQFYPVEEFNRTPAGRMVTRLVNDTSSLQDLFTGGVAVAFVDMMIIGGMIAWMIVMHPVLGLICVSVFPLMIWSASFFGSRIQQSFRESRAALSRMNAYLAENISGMWLIQIFNRQKDFRARFDGVSKNYTSKQLNTVQMFAYFQPSITILASLAMTLLIWFVESGQSIRRLRWFASRLHGLHSGDVCTDQGHYRKYNLFVSAMASSEQ